MLVMDLKSIFISKSMSRMEHFFMQERKLRQFKERLTLADIKKNVSKGSSGAL